MLLQGKTALITGSSRGIGSAMAERFAKEGAHVIVNARQAASLNAVCTRIAAAGGKATPIAADVSDSAAVKAMADKVQNEIGALDILIANAGGSYTPPGPLEEIEEADWHAAINGNLTTTFLTIKAFLPEMKARGSGAIITLSSAVARQPYAQTPAPYVAAKAGVKAMTQTLALQVAPFGIRANCIAPEVILTERNQQRFSPDQQSALAKTHPLPRLGTPEDIAEAALFLAAPQSSWITGIVLDVAGGAIML